MANFPLVIVHWLDAESSGSGWQDEEDFWRWCDEPVRPVKSVGWLVRDEPDKVVVMATDGGNEKGDAHKIPKTWVLNIEVLRPAEGGTVERGASSPPQPGI